MEIRILRSLHEVTREAWNACFAGELEDYDYLLAVEEAGMAGFSWRYVIAQHGGELIAAVPAFLTHYALDTTLEGLPKKIAVLVRTALPGVLTCKLACLGSPDTEIGKAGFLPSLLELERVQLLQQMLSAFEMEALECGYKLIGIKDIAEHDWGLWNSVITSQGYRNVGGLPVAHLPIDFADTDAYLGRLSYKTRKDMRRKLKARPAVRIEKRSNIDDVLPQVMALYQQTRARAQMQLEELTPRFFQQVLSSMKERAFCTLYWVEDRLLAVNLMLRNGTTLLDKFFCMDGEEGRAHNLYFLSWMHNIEYCLAHALTHYQSGQASYENKLRLGSKLTPTRMYFRHRNKLIQGALVLASPFLSADSSIQEAA